MEELEKEAKNKGEGKLVEEMGEVGVVTTAVRREGLRSQMEDCGVEDDGRRQREGLLKGRALLVKYSLPTFFFF